MAQSSGEPKFTLRLIVEEKKNKVVLAEACRDFVDVLFSLLTLPMATIVRLLENHRKSEAVTVGCFNNLYKSVVEMGSDSFETEACKQMLLYPRSVSDVQRKRLKLNINPTESIKCFRCTSYCSLYSNFNTSICYCRKFMNEEIPLENKEQVAGLNKNDANGVFVSGRSSFIITDDLEVAVKSTDFVLNKLKSLGCADFSKLGERLLDIGLKEVLTLLEYIFSSNAPLTDAFLNKQSPQGVTKKIYKSPSPCLEEKEDEKVVTLKAIVRKQDMKILYVECGDEFVELLFSFLAVPLGSVWEISGSSISLGCIGNLCRSFKDLSTNEGTGGSTSLCELPSFYSFRMQLPGIITQPPPVYYRYRLFSSCTEEKYGLTTNGNITPYFRKDKVVHVNLIDPKSSGSNMSHCYGFLKKDTKFTVLDDLTITSMNSCSTVCLLKKLQSPHADDLEVRVINISNAEALNLLRASLVTSSALSTALWNLIAKKLKKETELWNPVLKKVKKKDLK